MDNIAALMNANLPEGMTPKRFGEIMRWGRRNSAALDRIRTLTLE